MKKFFNLFIFVSLIAAGCSSSAQVYDNGQYNNENYSNSEVSYQTFYDQLQPYGNWIDYPEYGYVWQPNAGAGFRPYETNGHWVSTIDGWAWASDYNWGWAPFHYGRWMLDEAVGWIWVPGYEWAPAWVTWGQYDNYYAWAPLAPGINISMGNTWRAPYSYWNFVPNNYIQSQNLNRYVARNNFNGNVINNITIINNYNSYDNKEYYHRGPDYREVERFTHKNITPLAIAPASRPGMNSVTTRQFQVYRPAIVRNDAATRNVAPSVIRNMNEVRNNNIRSSNNGAYNPSPERPYNNTGVGNNPVNTNRDANINRPYNDNTINQNNQNNNTINQNRRFSENNDIYNQRRNQQPPIAPNINQPANPVSSEIRPGNQQNFPQRQINRNPAVNNPQPNVQSSEQTNRNIQRVENWRQQNNQPVRQMQPQSPAAMPTRPAMPMQQRQMPAAMPQRQMPVQRPERAPAAQPAQNGVRP